MAAARLEAEHVVHAVTARSTVGKETRHPQSASGEVLAAADAAGDFHAFSRIGEHHRVFVDDIVAVEAGGADDESSNATPNCRSPEVSTAGRPASSLCVRQRQRRDGCRLATHGSRPTMAHSAAELHAQVETIQRRPKTGHADLFRKLSIVALPGRRALHKHLHWMATRVTSV